MQYYFYHPLPTFAVGLEMTNVFETAIITLDELNYPKNQIS